MVVSEANKVWGASEVENLNNLTANLEKLYQKSIAGYKKADYMFLLEKMPPPPKGSCEEPCPDYI